MNKKIRFFFVVVCLPLIIAAQTLSNVQISGVRGKLLANIESRLIEITQTKSLAYESDDDIIAQIAKAIEPYGYFKPKITIYSRSNSKIAVAVSTGPQLLITHLDIRIIGIGHESRKINHALATVALKEGQPFNSVNYERAKQSLLSAVERQGYLHTSFKKTTVVIDKKNYTATITLVLDTGPQYFFGQIQFDPTYIKPELLHRYLPFKYGHHYSADKVLELNNYLTSSGYFKTVSIKPQLDNDARVVPIDVHLQRISHTNYSIGVGYGTDTGPRGRVGIHVIPVNRSGHKFNAVALSSFKENAIQTQYVIPGQNPVIDQYEFNSSLSNLNYDTGHSTAALLSLLQRRNLSNFQRMLSLNVLDERFRYDAMPKRLKFSVYPKLSYTWVSGSKQLFSPTGYKITLSALAASKALASNNNFSQLSIDAKAAVTFSTIHTRLYFHIINGVTQIHEIDQLPLSLALLLGGSDNLKGYRYASIGPGKLLSYSGIELQKETKKNWYLIGFFDTGNTFESLSTPRFHDLKNDAGLGLMWVSPVGPIKIGAAQAIDNHFHRTRKIPKLVISIGPDL
jgi:translocation and assembly module TamA